jgi:CheY-like chemotaxis protein
MNEADIHILLVDDEPNVLKALSRLLKQYHLSTACNSDEALLMASQQSFDLVITDYKMPGLYYPDLPIWKACSKR